MLTCQLRLAIELPFSFFLLLSWRNLIFPAFLKNPLTRTPSPLITSQFKPEPYLRLKKNLRPTAVKSATKNPCSNPDHIMMGINKTWIGFLSWRKVAIRSRNPEMSSDELSLTSDTSNLLNKLKTLKFQIFLKVTANAFLIDGVNWPNKICHNNNFTKIFNQVIMVQNDSDICKKSYNCPEKV